MKTKKMVLAALFIALSFVGANLKIMGTIAFDSLPAYIAALVLGPVYGAAVGFLGHLFTALLSGFPFGIAVHGVIAASMAIAMAGVGAIHIVLERRGAGFAGLAAAVVVGTILNGPVSLALSYPLLAPVMGAAGVWAMLPVLTAAGAVNVFLAALVYKALPRVWRRVA